MCVCVLVYACVRVCVFLVKNIHFQIHGKTCNEEGATMRGQFAQLFTSKYNIAKFIEIFLNSSEASNIKILLASGYD